MVALKNVWQAQKQERQQQAAQRQAEVQTALTAIQTDLQTQAQQLHHELGQFRTHLARENRARQTQSHTYQAQLRQGRQVRQQEIQQQLQTLGEQRQAQAQQVASQLDAYVQSLRTQTAQFLELTAAERSLMGQQLKQDLRHCHLALNEAVKSLRQELQHSLRSLQLETQAQLNSYHQTRMQQRLQLRQELATFATSLRTEVQGYLWEVELMRQGRAQQVQQDLLQSRVTRLAKAKALFERLAQFRSDLRLLVWGTSELTPALGLRSSTPETEKSASTGSGLSKPLQKPSLETSPTVPATPPTPQAAKSIESAPVSVALDKLVYHHICETQGARLVDIESALSINRIQAIDALRTLIQKNLIVQREVPSGNRSQRVYLPHEEASL